MLVPSALRRRREIREVEPEIVSPGDQKPWVLQLLAEGQLPGVNAEPVSRSLAADPSIEEEPPPAVPAVDRPTLVEVETKPMSVAGQEANPLVEERAQPPAVEAEQIPEEEAHRAAPPVDEPTTLVAVEPEPEPQPVAEIGEPVASKPVRKRAPAKHRPVKRASAPQRAAAHVPAKVETDAVEPHAEDVATAECAIRFWRGYRKANFYACVFTDDGEPLAVAESPLFRARGTGIPDKTDEAVAAYDALCKKLEDNGWQRASPGKTWFGDVFTQPA